MTREYIKKLCKFAAKLVGHGEIILSVSLSVLGAYLAIIYYVMTRNLLEAILYPMGFWPAALSFYAIVKFPPSPKRKSKTAVFWPALISFISYFVSFFVICKVKYTFYPPKDVYDEIFFLGHVIPASLALSFFLAGLKAKLGKVRSELYFIVSGFFGVITGVLDTLGLMVFGPLPQPWGLFPSIFMGLILGSLILIVSLVINMGMQLS